MNNKEINIGLIGLGYIGSGVFELINNQREYIKKKIKKELRITTVCEKNADRIEEFKKKYSGVTFTGDVEDIIENPDIDIVIELMGGIDPAFKYITEALKNKKFVVTANKDLIAEKGQEIFHEAEKNNVDILFEASVGGGIPIIGPLKSSLASNNIYKIVGIVNGTTNYILTMMQEEGLSFDDALSSAQKLGYAELNPESDIEGIDAANKLAILSSIAFNSRVRYADVFREGIKKISFSDISYADELGYCIKLLAIGSEEDKKINVRVHPALIPQDHILSSIKDTFNAVYFYGNYVGEIMSFGRGAGDRPTASSIVGDIITIARNYDRQDKHIIYGCSCFEKKEIIPFLDTTDRFYVLMDVVDRAGVLAKIAKVFGDNVVSIKSMLQKQIDVKDTARLIFITHDTINRNLYNALEKIKKIDVVKNIINIIRVEDLEG